MKDTNESSKMNINITTKTKITEVLKNEWEWESKKEREFIQLKQWLSWPWQTLDMGQHH